MKKLKDTLSPPVYVNKRKLSYRNKLYYQNHYNYFIFAPRASLSKQMTGHFAISPNPMIMQVYGCSSNGVELGTDRFAADPLCVGLSDLFRESIKCLEWRKGLCTGYGTTEEIAKSNN